MIRNSADGDVPHNQRRDAAGTFQGQPSTPKARRDADPRSPIRGVDGSASPRKSRVGHVGPGKQALAAPELRPRTSRWADEVDEDDQFMPEPPRITRSQRQVTEEVPSTGPSKSSKQYSHARRADEPVQEIRPDSKGDRYKSERAKGGKGQEFRTRDKPRYSRPDDVNFVKAKPSVQNIEEISNMKEIMARKAEEKKRVKEEEEARLEAERRARCEAKLREIEERKRSRTSSLVSPVSEGLVIASGTGSAPSCPIDARKVNAFNVARRELRDQREHDRKGDDRLDITAANVPAPVLSPNAKEFVPSGPIMPIHHWPGYPHHPVAPHHMAPMVQPPPHMPVGHLPPQLPPGHMGYGYPQYPPQFAPYGYPHPPPPGPHQMGNHYF